MAAIFTFDTTVEGFTGERYNGAASEAELSWQASGYPAGGSIKQDALDSSGTSSSDRYFLNFVYGTYSQVVLPIGATSSFWYRITNRIAATRWFDINISGGGAFAPELNISCPASGTTGWRKISAVEPTGDTQTTIQIQCVPTNGGPGVAYKWDGFYTLEVDNIYIGDVDTTLGVTNFQSSQDGIPTTVLEGEP